MAMDKITGSPLLRQGILDNSRQNERVSKDGKPADVIAEIAPANSNAAAGDRAEISETGKRLVELRQTVEVGRVALAALPEIREDKVAAARERLESGYYDNDAVRYTQKDGVLYAWFVTWPDDGRVVLPQTASFKPSSIELLGGNSSLGWTQNGDAVVVELPEQKTGKYVWGLKLARSTDKI